ncbi:hypothetical protein [Burkholderia seminalis]|uniref:hypothetical protein n=1 Tax=Burkholderia seminalis TaxID=488731 RepID=UPI00264D64B4|nr:hypothetical protein [Burkholderia seminalis]MDN7592242.1 hypothetical protein [Burkholderia seminalis]
MIAKKPTILLFEDTETTAERIEKILTQRLSKNFEIKVFSSAVEATDASFVDRLKEEIPKYGEVALVISDMDLSKIDRYKGLTDAVITRVSHDLGIPAAYYSTALAAIEGQKQDQAGDGRILLGAPQYEVIAHKICILAEGFVSIKKNIESILSRKSIDRPQSASEFVAELIGRKETFHRIGLYVSGDQRMGAEILSSPKDKAADRQTTIFGTWIFDSLMRYPGVFVNTTAAASYLNIEPSQFLDKEIFQLWKDAIYTGPFSDESNPIFWRDKLDRILSEESAEDGRDYLSKKGIFVNSCPCSVDESVDAGYYCMITERPVSYEHSVGNISWFPPGADLARIAAPKYDELAPWLSV